MYSPKQSEMGTVSVENKRPSLVHWNCAQISGTGEGNKYSQVKS